MFTRNVTNVESKKRDHASKNTNFFFIYFYICWVWVEKFWNFKTFFFVHRISEVCLVCSRKKKKHARKYENRENNRLHIECKDRKIQKFSKEKIIDKIYCKRYSYNDTCFFWVSSDVWICERSAFFCQEKNRPKKKVANHCIDACLFVVHWEKLIELRKSYSKCGNNAKIK